MSDSPGSGLWSITLNLLALGVTVAIAIWLAPLAFDAMWRFLPAVLLLWLIIAVFRSLLSNFLGRR